MTGQPRAHAELFMPGRLCLFGEHSDWAARHGRHAGYCLIVGTDQGLKASAQPARDFVVETALPPEPPGSSVRWRTMRCAFEATALQSAASDREEFFRHCAGVAWQMIGRPDVRGGLALRIHAMDLPLKKGVSSSAAVCVLVARAFDRVYGLGLFPHEIMDLAYRGERMTGSQCGRMDQACIFGKTPVLVSFTGAEDIRVEPVFPESSVCLFFVDLAGRKDTVRILADLQSAYPSSKALQEALGPANERIVRQAYAALSAADAERLGTCMSQAQELFDAKVAPHSPQELASPRLHEVLALGELARHIHGGKGVGSQGDGTAQFVARSAEDREAAMAIIESRLAPMRCFPLTIVPARQGGPG